MNRTFFYKTTTQSSKSKVCPITKTLIDLITRTYPSHSLPTVPEMPSLQRLQHAAFGYGISLDSFGLEHFSGVPWLSWLWLLKTMGLVFCSISLVWVPLFPVIRGIMLCPSHSVLSGGLGFCTVPLLVMLTWGTPLGPSARLPFTELLISPPSLISILWGGISNLCTYSTLHQIFIRLLISLWIPGFYFIQWVIIH